MPEDTRPYQRCPQDPEVSTRPVTGTAFRNSLILQGLWAPHKTRIGRLLVFFHPLWSFGKNSIKGGKKKARFTRTTFLWVIYDLDLFFQVHCQVILVEGLVKKTNDIKLINVF